jgi:hypothetical protein
VKQSFHLAIKARAQVRRNLRIITDRSGEFLVCFGMKQVLHRPATLRARPSHSSSGTPSNFPASISAIRWSVSVFHSVATDGSTPPWRAAIMRSTDSATTSSGISRVSSTISWSVIGMIEIWLTKHTFRRTNLAEEDASGEGEASAGEELSKKARETNEPQGFQRRGPSKCRVRSAE